MISDSYCTQHVEVLFGYGWYVNYMCDSVLQLPSWLLVKLKESRTVQHAAVLIVVLTRTE